MESATGGRARRLIITGIVAAGLGAGGAGVALASAGSARTHHCTHMGNGSGRPASGSTTAS